MNIFYLHKCPKRAAQLQYNKHVVKMILESAQMLCTAHHCIMGSDADVPYKVAHRNHPSTKWARQSGENYAWLYWHMIELGKTLPLISKEHKTEENIITGCQSKVWIHAALEKDQLVFTADSDAIITKGIIALLIRVFSNQHPKDILDSEIDFIDRIGLKEHLSPTRANGMVSMIKQIKMYAIAFQTQLN